MLVDLVHHENRRRMATIWPFTMNMGLVHMQGLQDPRAVGDDQQSALSVLLVLFHALGSGTHGVHVQAGIRLISRMASARTAASVSCRVSDLLSSRRRKSPTFRLHGLP